MQSSRLAMLLELPEMGDCEASQFLDSPIWVLDGRHGPVTMNG